MSWEITTKEINAIWNATWPKIVALAWKDDVYRRAFESNAAFRVDEVKRVSSIIGGTYQSDIPINLDDLSSLDIDREKDLGGNEEGPNPHPTICRTIYGDTFFRLGAEGLGMPWPSTPTQDKIFLGYTLGGGRLPRKSPTLSQDEKDRIDNISTGWRRPTDQQPGSVVAGISGFALLRLFELWPKVIAFAWRNPSDRALVIQDPKPFMMPDVWVRWPSIAVPYVDEASNEIKLKHDSGSATIDLIVPLPPNPTDLLNILDELILGQACNPMYSNCYC